MRKTIFIKNAIILTVSGIILRFIGVVFKVWLASAIGSEGIGLYGLIFSVYVFSATFATSGISTAVTRLIADDLPNNNDKNIKKILYKCIFISFVIAIISLAILYFGADFIANIILCDARAVNSIKILSFSLPFMGICSCIKGYFIARRKATTPAVSQILEQITRIAVVFLAIKTTNSKNIGLVCSKVLIGDVASEIIACLFLYLIYQSDVKKLKTQDSETLKYNLAKEIKHIAFPITLGRYLNSFLRTAENILVPKMLKIYENGAKTALSQFGMIKGMALPIVFFPSTMLNSVSTLLIPELSVAKKRGQNAVLSKIIENILKITLISSYIFASIFFVCGKQIGVLIYKNESVGYLIKLLAPIVPLMYIDSISDGMLKGLDEQKFTFKTSVGDSSLRILLIIIMLPRFGLRGFVFIMYISNSLTAILNVSRVVSIGKTGWKSLRRSVFSLFFALICTLICDTLVSNIANISNLVYIILVSLSSITIYLFFEKFIMKENLIEMLK